MYLYAINIVSAEVPTRPDECVVDVQWMTQDERIISGDTFISDTLDNAIECAKDYAREHAPKANTEDFGKFNGIYDFVSKGGCNGNDV